MALAADGVGRPVRPELPIERILYAIRAYGLTYRAMWEPNCWVAQCVNCRKWGLQLTENEETLAVVLGCSHRCMSSELLRGMLRRNPERIRLEREVERWKAHSTWLTEFTRRALGPQGPVESWGWDEFVD